MIDLRWPKRKTRGGNALWGFLLLCCPLVAQGQEAIRMSLASAEAAEARRKAAGVLGRYNLKLGPSYWRFAAGFQVEYNDNLLAAAVDPQEDIVFRPEISTRMLLPLTDRNNISLSLGAGYSAAINNPDYNRVFITPGTELSFDLYVGNVWLNFHNRFSITKDSYTDPTVVGTADYSLLENDLGVTALWDLNRIIWRLGYDHSNYIGLNDSSGAAPDATSENFYTTVAYELADAMYAGVELGGGFISYGDSAAQFRPYSEATQFGAGLFYEARLSTYIRGRVSGGYTLFMPSAAPGAEVEGEFSGYYARISLNHRLNRYISYSLSGGRSISFTFYGGTVDLYTASLGGDWQLIRGVGLSAAMNYQHGSYLYGSPEVFDHFGPGLSLTKQLSEKLASSLVYNRYWRTSNLPDRDYTVNSVSVRLRYQF